jgi:hypothetical protein
MFIRHTSYRLVSVILLSALLSLLAACGSTKVYTADKTVVHKGSIYNLGNVSKIGTRIDGQLPDGEVVSMTNMDRKEVESLLDEHDEILVSTVFDLDEQEMVYQRVRVDSWRSYSQVVSSFESASKKMTRFMADKKDTQLKL